MHLFSILPEDIWYIIIEHYVLISYRNIHGKKHFNEVTNLWNVDDSLHSIIIHNIIKHHPPTGWCISYLDDNIQSQITHGDYMKLFSNRHGISILNLKPKQITPQLIAQSYGLTDEEKELCLTPEASALIDLFKHQTHSGINDIKYRNVSMDNLLVNCFIVHKANNLKMISSQSVTERLCVIVFRFITPSHIPLKMRNREFIDKLCIYRPILCMLISDQSTVTYDICFNALRKHPLLINHIDNKFPGIVDVKMLAYSLSRYVDRRISLSQFKKLLRPELFHEMIKIRSSLINKAFRTIPDDKKDVSVYQRMIDHRTSNVYLLPSKFSTGIMVIKSMKHNYSDYKRINMKRIVVMKA